MEFGCTLLVQDFREGSVDRLFRWNLARREQLGRLVIPGMNTDWSYRAFHAREASEAPKFSLLNVSMRSSAFARDTAAVRRVFAACGLTPERILPA